jgi:hypothetical protein
MRSPSRLLPGHTPEPLDDVEWDQILSCKPAKLTQRQREFYFENGYLLRERMTDVRAQFVRGRLGPGSSVRHALGVAPSRVVRPCLFLLLLTGLYMFVLPYATKWSGGRGAGA